MSRQRGTNLRLSIFVWPGWSGGRQAHDGVMSWQLSCYQTVNNSKRALFLPAVTIVMIPCMWDQGSTVTALENSRRRKVRTAVLWVITHAHTHTRHAQGRAHHAKRANTTESRRQRWRWWRPARDGLELKPSHACAVIHNVVSWRNVKTFHR